MSLGEKCWRARGRVVPEFKRQHRAAEADPPANPLPRRLEFE